MPKTILEHRSKQTGKLPEESRRARLLVVEDDEFTRMILEKRLTKNGYEVITASDGQQGWEMAQEIRPDVIISDWMMPRMDGHELCSKIKSDEDLRSIYFILLTAKDCKDDMVEGLDAGADEYLVKPCDSKELLARVRAGERVVNLQRSLEEKNAALEKAMERINRELKVTSEIQRALLPQKLPEIPGYEFGAYYRPSTECSGDYYDLIELGDQKFGMVMADVSGHGTPAMVAMALGRSLVHQLTLQARSPAELLGLTNKLMFHHLPTSQYMTMFYGICDPKTGVIQYSSAGHNPPLLIRADGRAEFLTGCEGFPIKLISPDADYDDHEIQLQPGDKLLLYTDGIPEARNAAGELFESDRFTRAAEKAGAFGAEEALESIIDTLAEYTDGTPLEDDVTMLLIHRLEAEPRPAQ